VNNNLLLLTAMIFAQHNGKLDIAEAAQVAEAALHEAELFLMCTTPELKQ
jgi:hypothetical protein